MRRLAAPPTTSFLACSLRKQLYNRSATFVPARTSINSRRSCARIYRGCPAFCSPPSGTMILRESDTLRIYIVARYRSWAIIKSDDSFDAIKIRCLSPSRDGESLSLSLSFSVNTRDIHCVHASGSFAANPRLHAPGRVQSSDEWKVQRKQTVVCLPETNFRCVFVDVVVSQSKKLLINTRINTNVAFQKRENR